ncbi:hypothetical protein PIG48_28380, partial [Escherichia coli]|nr:hypothetical protein [Escherichia coli]
MYCTVKEIIREVLDTDVPDSECVFAVVLTRGDVRHIACVFRSIRSRIGIEVRSAIRIHSINRELNFFYRFLTRFFAAFH